MSSKTLRLHAGSGATEASVGGNLYAADADGIIAVDAMDGGLLLGVPGFTDTAFPPPPSGFVRMKAPEGATTCSVGGTTYEVADDGHVIVPSSNELASHGFVAVENITGAVLTPYVPEPFVMDPSTTYVPDPDEADAAPVFVHAAPAAAEVVAEPAVVVAEPAAPVVAAEAAPVAEPIVADAVKE